MSSSSVSVMMLMGLPGAGKSTFCTWFRDQVKLRKQGCRVIVVNYDELVPLERQRLLKDNPGEWKSLRESILGAVEFHIAKLRQKDDFNSQSDGDASQNLAAMSPDVTAFVQQLSVISEDGGDSSKTVVIIDDNNYLRSMRYSFYQLARKYSLGFCQIHLDCDRSLAIEHNKSRSVNEQVSESVIINMADKMEPPDPLKHSWERFSFTIAVTSNTQFNFELVESVVELSFSCPESPLEDKTEEKEKDRVLCSANVVHQSDKHLRGIIHTEMTALKKKNLEKEEMKTFSEKYYSAKNDILEDMRTGFLKLDKELVNKVNARSKDSSQALAEAMSHLFLERVGSVTGSG